MPLCENTPGRRWLATIGVMCAAAALPAGAQVTSTWVGAGAGDWNDATRWDTAPVFPDNGQPGAGDTYDAILPTGANVRLNQDIIIEDLTQSGKLSDDATATERSLSVNQLFDWRDDDIEGRVTVAANGDIDINGADEKRMTVTASGIPEISSFAAATWTGGGVNATAIGGDRPIYTNELTGSFDARADTFFDPTFDNLGAFERTVGTGTVRFGGPFNNQSIASIETGALEFAGGGSSGGAYIVMPGATIYFVAHDLQAFTSVVTGGGTVRFSNPGGGGLAGDTVVNTSGTYGVGATVLDGNLQFNTTGSTGTLEIDRPAGGSAIDGSGTLSASGATDYKAGNVTGAVTINADGGLDFSNSDPVLINGSAAVNLGAASTWSGAGAVRVEQSGQLNVQPGATFDVVATLPDGGRRIADLSTPGTFTVSGTLRKTGDGDLDVEVPTTNAGLIDAQDGTIDFAAGLTQTGPGAEIRLNGGAVDGVLLLLDGSLTGSGTLWPAVNSSAVIGPGASAGALNFDDDLTLMTGGVLQMEIGSTSQFDFDRLDVTSLLTYGGELEVTLINGFVPAAGNNFDLFDFGSAAGVFDDGVTLPDLPGAHVWDTSSLLSTGILRVAVVLLPGDGNNDGTVTAEDLLSVQQGFGNIGPNGDGSDFGDTNDDGMVTADDLLTIQQNFGNTLGPAAVPAGGSVPEPATAVLLAALGGLVRRAGVAPR